MGYEKRGNGSYYYKKERDGKRVVSRYYGRGELADLIAQLDAIEHFKNESEAQIQRKNREKDKEIDCDLSLLEAKIKKLIETQLTNLGFYKTKSREWRIKKMILKLRSDNKEMSEIFNATNQESPKQKDVAALDKVFEENPHVWESIGNFAEQLKESIIQSDLSKNHLIYEATKRKLADLRDQLGWANSSQLEKIIIEQICLNWLRHSLLESTHSTKTRESHTLAIGQHWDKLLTQSQNRYLRSVESLAKVRKLLAEAELKEQQARNKRSQSTLISQKILKNATS